MKLSIVIPHYERKELLIEALDSVANNDYPQKNYEVVVVDDCSSQDMAEIYDYKKIENYRVFRLGANSGGASIPRNFGMLQAQGKYVMFLDSDDYISDKALSKAVSIAERGKCDFVIIKHVSSRKYAKGYEKLTRDLMGVKIGVGDRHTLEDFLFTNNSVVGKIMRLDLIRKFGIRFPETLIIAEDCVFWKWYYTIVKVAGVCATETYTSRLAVTGNLSLHKTTPQEAIDQLCFLTKNIFTMPEEFVSWERKARSLNARLGRPYVTDLLKNPKYVRILKEKCGKYFAIVKDNPEMNEDSRGFVGKVLTFKEGKKL